MHLFLSLFAVLLAVLALVSWVASRPRGRQLCALVNVAEGFWRGGKWTGLADASWSGRYLLVLTGTDQYHVNLCGALGQPKGICFDEPANAGDEIEVRLLGASMDETPLVQVSGAVAVDALLVAAANGQAQTLPIHGGGTAWVFGKAFSTGTNAGDLVEFIPTLPYQVTIPA